MSMMPMNGASSPPRPYMSRLRRNSAAALMARDATPRNASGISTMMINALKMIAERIALCGLVRFMTLSASSPPPSTP